MIEFINYFKDIILPSQLEEIEKLFLFLILFIIWNSIRYLYSFGYSILVLG